jgi:hypothetical protein
MFGIWLSWDAGSANVVVLFCSTTSYEAKLGILDNLLFGVVISVV